GPRSPSAQVTRRRRCGRKDRHLPRHWLSVSRSQRENAMINRRTLQFSLAWRLGLLLLIVSAAAIGYLRWRACQVAAGYQTDVAHAVLFEFLVDVAWTIPVFGVLALIMGNWAIRSGLAPLRALSADVSRIKPGSPSALLSGSRMLPGEVMPLVC